MLARHFGCVDRPGGTDPEQARVESAAAEGPSVTTELVPLHGDVIEAMRTADGKVFASIKRCCESLGVAEQSQAAKLKNREWAVTTMIVATGPDGKRYDSLMIDLESLPMWLATIHSSKVVVAVRAKLLAY